MAIGEVTRLTSANLHIEFQPARYPRIEAGAYADYDTVQNHVVVLNLNGNTAGTFKLVVNGHKTAAITAGASLASTAVQSALEDLPNVATGDLAVTGSAGGPFTITAAQALLNEFLVIEVADDATASGVLLSVTSQGSKWYVLSAEVSSFSFADTQETVDVTGISETDRRHATTVRDATFDLTLYEALQDYRAILQSGVEGYLRVFEDGKATGKRYFAWEVLFTDSSSDFKAFEKIEISVSGRRQGAPIARVGSYWS